MIDATGITRYYYDDMRRLVTNDSPQGKLYYAYDKAGSVTNISSSTTNGVRLGYEYEQVSVLTIYTRLLTFPPVFENLKPCHASCASNMPAPFIT